MALCQALCSSMLVHTTPLPQTRNLSAFLNATRTWRSCRNSQVTVSGNRLTAVARGGRNGSTKRGGCPVACSLFGGKMAVFSTRAGGRERRRGRGERACTFFAAKKARQTVGLDDERGRWDGEWWEREEFRGEREGEKSSDNDDDSIVTEALEALEWDRMCNACAGFAGTSLGYDQIKRLPIGKSAHESWKLLAETKAAMELESRLGAVDFASIRADLVRDAIVKARKTIPLQGSELIALANALRGSTAIQRSVANIVSVEKSIAPTLKPISSLVEPLVPHGDLVRAIFDAVEEDGTVKDSASPELRKARVQVRTMEARLEEMLSKIARGKGAAGSQGDPASSVVANVGGRLCISTVADGRTTLPGLLLQGGEGGSSLYVEPQAAVPLNNKLAEARADAQKAEGAVLLAFTKRLQPWLEDFEFMLNVVLRLDVMVARARYSSWLGATEPQLIDLDAQQLQPLNDQPTTSKDAGTGMETVDDEGEVRVMLRRARHPLLLQQHREKLRIAKLNLKSIAKQLGRARVRAGVSRVRPLAGPGKAQVMDPVSEAELALSQAEAQVAELEGSPPVPIDLVVRGKIRVVAITGPNTGGKTLAIKMLGLAALMAKAGLYVLAAEPVVLPWFDEVLADIGDSQSLSQSLSTFSGHILRIQRIRARSTGRSLVLLDEVGGGTDPTEGAALGMALLQAFAETGKGGSLLTMATTHHGHLKTLKYRDRRFENASVEFDEERLAPTYRLLWGIPGRSNALNIVERLGLPESIVTNARLLHGTASSEVNDVIMNMELARKAVEDGMEEMERLSSEGREMEQRLREVARERAKHRATVVLRSADAVALEASNARSSFGRTMRKFQEDRRAQDAERSLSRRTATSSGQKRSGGKSGGKDGGVTSSRPDKQYDSDSDSASFSLPQVGDIVFVPKLNLKGSVVKVKASKKEIVVQCGMLQARLNVGEFHPI